MNAFHDEMTADRVLLAGAILGAAATAMLVYRRPSARVLGWTVAGALAVTLASGLATSTGLSGTTVRTRGGAPHSFVTANVDPDAPEKGRTHTFDWAYFALDACFWSIVGVTLACSTAKYRCFPGRRRSS